jgi:hypothetical protein
MSSTYFQKMQTSWAEVLEQIPRESWQYILGKLRGKP